MSKPQEVKKTWIIEQVHGLWWGYIEPRPETWRFFTHGRPHTSMIIGPYHSQGYAEQMAEKTPVHNGLVSKRR
jgi:hypothetical protein